MRVTLPAILFLAACYSPDLSKTRYTCIESNPICPAGTSCIEGYCCAGSEPCGPDVTQPEPDGGTTTPVDWTMPPAAAPGCASGRGYAISSRAMACPGAFASGQMLSRCAAGWTLCPTSPLSVVDAAKVPHLFVGSAHGNQKTNQPDSTMACSWSGAPASNYLFLFGIGAQGRTLVRDSSTQGRCGLYPSALECVTSTTGGAYWTCPLAGSMPTDADAAQVANPIEQDGVLCCS